jgi:hypothetical protein
VRRRDGEEGMPEDEYEKHRDDRYWHISDTEAEAEAEVEEDEEVESSNPREVRKLSSTLLPVSSTWARLSGTGGIAREDDLDVEIKEEVKKVIDLKKALWGV